MNFVFSFYATVFVVVVFCSHPFKYYVAKTTSLIFYEVLDFGWSQTNDINCITYMPTWFIILRIVIVIKKLLL